MTSGDLSDADSAVQTAAASPAEPARHTRIADIEALRAVAILFVMVEHANFNLVFHPTLLLQVLQWGQFWPGVDLFFVISGFLVTGDLLRRLPTGIGKSAFWLAASQFWLRRAFRLWPTAWLWLVLITTGSAIWYDPAFLGPLTANIRAALAGVLFYANYLTVTTVWTPYGASFPYWSLSLEEQFYILLPFVIMVAGRLLPLLVAGAILLQFPLAHGRFYFFFRSDALLWGVGLALLHRAAIYRQIEPTALRSRALASFVVVAALGIVFSVAGTGNVSPPFVIGSIAAISAVLVWLATYDRGYVCPKLLRPLALWMGSRSYAMYVAHMPVYLCSAALAHHVFTPRDHIFSGAGNAYAVAIMVPLMLVSVEATHRLVERPIRHIGARIAGHTAPAA